MDRKYKIEVTELQRQRLLNILADEKKECERCSELAAELRLRDPASDVDPGYWLQCADETKAMYDLVKAAEEQDQPETAPQIPFRPGLAVWCKDKAECLAMRKELHFRDYEWYKSGALNEEAINEENGVRFFISADGHVTHSLNRDYRTNEGFEYVDFSRVSFDPGDILYNGKVICVDPKNNVDTYTKGKIYQFKDGFLADDTGNVFPYKGNPVRTFDEWSEWTTAEFIEVVE